MNSDKIFKIILYVLSKTFWFWFAVIAITIGFVLGALWLS